jgi:MSHA biogenesis protein MshQ
MGGATLASFFNGSAGGAEAGVYDYSEPGSGSVAIPVGATGVTIQVWGAGGGGATGFEYFIAPGEFDIIDGGGGGGGGYSKTVLTFSGQDGKTILYTVGAGGAGAGAATAGGFSNVYSGTYTLTTMTSNGGQPGNAGPLQTQGAGGTASGGNTVPGTTGNGGAAYTSAGALPLAGDGSLTAGGGGDGSYLGGEPGQNGRVRMVFTF